jgi:hypothetical protein
MFRWTNETDAAALEGRRSRRRILSAGACVPLAAVVFVVTPAGLARAAVGSAQAAMAGQARVAASYAPADLGSADAWNPGGYPMMTGPTAPSGAPGAGNAAATTSQNWAGYAAAGASGSFTSVSASWLQPGVTCSFQQTFSSFWVGLDGDGTQSVEQTGTEADCSSGAAAYQGWYEMYPNAPVYYDNPVQPGDAMSASVVANGGGAFTLTLSDHTQGWTQTTNQTSTTAQLGSAEIIAEAPSSGTVLPLADFGTVSFGNAIVDGAALGNANAAALSMVSAAGVTEAVPSALTPSPFTNGDDFSVTWDSSGT